MKKVNGTRILALIFTIVSLLASFAYSEFMGAKSGNVQQETLETRRLVSSNIAETFYVAPNGSDANNGTIGYPFQTIARAQQEVQSNISSGMTGDVVVYLRNGTLLSSAPMNP